MTVMFPDAVPRLRKPAGPVPDGQPWWNPQRTSDMPAGRYRRAATRLPEPVIDRSWPDRVPDRAPLWTSVDLRDGNQALASPMNSARKSRMFDLLVRMGFKEIEIGYPAASDTEFNFVRELITGDRIPDDVTISVFTPARADLIDRTFDAIRGVGRAVVHLCLATACLWRTVVFATTMAEVRDRTLESARQVARRADQASSSRLRLQYSPEAFNATELEFALEVSNAVIETWDPSPDHPVTVNLPTTVETDSPNVFADQVEWMHRNLDRRDSIILSVHPHNDRGTAVASAELALKAGAERVEGTLFGNGERTGNVCLATLALNLFSTGVDPQLDFSDIDGIRRVVESCNQLPVHLRHPYVGDLVYTAFSGTHQDAIAKGLAALDATARESGRPRADLAWQVPYLPIDPQDVGRSYESVIRVNSQSGKGGVAHVLRSRYGFDLPRALRIELAAAVQRRTDESGVEMNSRELWNLFRAEYLEPRTMVRLTDLRTTEVDGGVRVDVVLALPDGEDGRLRGTGPDVVRGLVDALARGGQAVTVRHLTDHDRAGSPAAQTVTYAEICWDGAVSHGVGVDPVASTAAVSAVLCAVNRALAAGGRWRRSPVPAAT